jgi:hypothetical protein
MSSAPTWACPRYERGDPGADIHAAGVGRGAVLFVATWLTAG